MHPIERLRYLARSGSLPARALVQEAATALANFADEPQGFLTACQRVVARQPGCAALVWLVARAITSVDPYDELWIAAGELQADPTARLLADVLPEGVVVIAVCSAASGEGELGDALTRRGDVEVLRIDRPHAGSAGSEGSQVVGASGIGSAVAAAALVLIEADAIGPDGALVPIGGLAAAACGHALGVPVWLIGGIGRQLGPQMWAGLVAPFERADPWNGDREIVALNLVDRIAGQHGLVETGDPPASALCPECPELFRGLVV